MRTRHCLVLRLVLLFDLGLGLGLGLGPSTSRNQVRVLPSNKGTADRKLTGKFLHITDIHPDPYYKTYSSTAGDDACHRGHGPAGIYGAETSDCDTPISLLNATFKWIQDNISDDIDFIIWTGDSARHDNDVKIPRNEKQVVEQNQLVVDKFQEVFGKSDDDNDRDPTNDFVIPIIPTFGNNDILPHNIFKTGPNKWTRKYLDIWRPFIPEEQRHSFQSGGWFYAEVLRNQLAVFSLNTLYFFDSNSAVDGCAVKSEPGFEQFEWLRIQLQIMRERGMKVILTGHVPPARVDRKVSWDETCWQKYTLWMQQYRDIIIGSLYGHMNIDHFMLQDFKDVKKHIRNGLVLAEDVHMGEGDAEFSVANAGDYLIDLRDLFAKIPAVSDSGSSIRSEGGDKGQTWPEHLHSLFATQKKPKKKKGRSGLDKIGGEYAERYSMSFVSPSVVPNYFPTLRVFEYNITGLKSAAATSFTSPTTIKHTRAIFASNEDDRNIADRSDNGLLSTTIVREEVQSGKKKQHKFKIPQPPSTSSPPGPAYSPQPLSLLGYTQYFANLTHINNDFLADRITEDTNSANSQRWNEGHHQGKVKQGKPNPKEFKFQVEYDTFSDDVFGLKDLTVRSYVNLAKRIAMSTKGGKIASEESEEVDNETIEEGENTHADKKEKKNKKKKKKKKHNKHSNKTWYTFVRRAFVNTVDPTDLQDQHRHQRIASQENSASLEL